VRKSLSLVTAAAASAAVALLAACSGTGSQGSVSTLPASGASQSHMLSDAARSGVAPKYFALLRPLAHHRGIPDKKNKGDLFVSDFGLNAVEELANTSWSNVGAITTGTNGPDGEFVEGRNLYVANYAGVDIGEYNSASVETFTYSAGMADPVDVTVDKHGNVFEADYDYPNTNGFVNEYAQGTNTVIATCYPGGPVEGVAVDKHGNVFADYNLSSSAQIVEYAGGLSGCHGTVLPITLGFAGGMALDKHGDLVVCDQTAPAVDVIAPPYTSITGTLGSGYEDPFHVTINKKNKQAYVTDLGALTVDVLAYPSGTSIATLGSANGLYEPAAAVDSANYVP
jgi:DNA-binding beta-propeller fold protein YncE